MGENVATTNLIVIVGRNNLHLTKLALKSALAQDINCEVLFIDNASTDGTKAYIASKLTARMFFKEQVSLAKCWNFGLAAAFAVGYEHVLVLNNDVEIRPDTYRLLLANGGPFVTCVSVATREELRVDDQPTSSSPHPDFSCFLIRKQVVDKIGWFDEEYWPAYCEDNDYHVRMHRGGIVAISIDLPFLHHAASTLKNCDPSERNLIQRGAATNRAKFKEKYGVEIGTPSYDELFK